MQNESQKNCNLKPLSSPVAEGSREENIKKGRFLLSENDLLNN